MSDLADDRGLLQCPCGEHPAELIVMDSGQGGKWAFVYGDCCGDWHVEFRADYHDPESDECMLLARDAWNAARRGSAHRRCPVPIPGDDGTAKQCIGRGHCGCDEKDFARIARNRDMIAVPAGLLANIYDNLADMPINEEWAALIAKDLMHILGAEG